MGHLFKIIRLMQSNDGDILKQIEETLEIMQLDIEQNQHLISTLKTLSDEQKVSFISYNLISLGLSFINKL